MAELFAPKSYVDEELAKLSSVLAEVKSQVQNLQLQINGNNVGDLVSRQDEAFSIA